MIYGTLEHMMQKGQFKFMWVGLAILQEDVTNAEREALVPKFKKLGAYPIFMTMDEV